MINGTESRLARAFGDDLVAQMKLAMINKPLSEQLAIVTGGGTGIGRGLYWALPLPGSVVIASRRESVWRAAADEG